MAFSMHSHSGQFCPGHAKDQLEEIVQQAISLKMRALALTEHIPRNEIKDLYPDDISEGQSPTEALQLLASRHPHYITEAVRLREAYKSQISIIIGIEGEWIRPAYGELLDSLLAHPEIDFCLGSLHHMHEIPIDYDRAMYVSARGMAGGTDERLWEDYYDAQYEMLVRMRPKIVSHFDLIRLFSDEPNREPREWKGVWDRIVRNLDLVKEQGGLVEINTSALRKGLKEPYPVKSICEYFDEIGGTFTLSDDSHGVAQVGLNFQKGIQHLEDIGVSTLYYLRRSDIEGFGAEKRQILVEEVAISDLDVQHHPTT